LFITGIIKADAERRKMKGGRESEAQLPEAGPEGQKNLFAGAGQFPGEKSAV
jgi:hypothetical protein